LSFADKGNSVPELSDALRQSDPKMLEIAVASLLMVVIGLVSLSISAAPICVIVLCGALLGGPIAAILSRNDGWL
jgi:hypothetical protein